MFDNTKNNKKNKKIIILVLILLFTISWIDARCCLTVILHNHNFDFLEETQISPPVKV